MQQRKPKFARESASHRTLYFKFYCLQNSNWCALNEQQHERITVRLKEIKKRRALIGKRTVVQVTNSVSKRTVVVLNPSFFYFFNPFFVSYNGIGDLQTWNCIALNKHFFNYNDNNRHRFEQTGKRFNFLFFFANAHFLKTILSHRTLHTFAFACSHTNPPEGKVKRVQFCQRSISIFVLWVRGKILRNNMLRVQ